jgi:hypothetical protein
MSNISRFYTNQFLMVCSILNDARLTVATCMYVTITSNVATRESETKRKSERASAIVGL